MGFLLACTAGSWGAPQHPHSSVQLWFIHSYTLYMYIYICVHIIYIYICTYILINRLMMGYGDGWWCAAPFFLDSYGLLAACRTAMGCGAGRWCGETFIYGCGELPHVCRPVIGCGNGAEILLSLAVGSFLLHVGLLWGIQMMVQCCLCPWLGIIEL